MRERRKRRHSSPLRNQAPFSQIEKRVTEGRTDRPANGWTDIPSYGDAWTHLKTRIFPIEKFMRYNDVGKNPFVVAKVDWPRKSTDDGPIE